MLGPLRQTSPDRVSLHIPEHREQMMIALHGEGLEAVLIEVSSANRAMVGVPPDGVSGS
jgi:hypothetical protein